MAPFKDWIPADEDTGAQGQGFKDFVPAKVPVTEPEIKEPTQPVEEVVIKTTKNRKIRQTQ
jgi:hypothetical protein